MIKRLRRLAGRTLTGLVSLRTARMYRLLSKAEVNPFCSVSPQRGLSYDEARSRFGKGDFLVPNLSGFYHGILRNWWEQYGLGETCLLVSETRAVGRVFRDAWPETRFVTTDYYLDLQPHPQCDLVWNLCSPDVPVEFRGAFASIVCQATLEHVPDPVQTLRNLATALRPGGMLYVQTHTPAYRYHGYPCDYLRYFPDWFKDVGGVLGTLGLVELLCLDGHAFAAYRRL